MEETTKGRLRKARHRDTLISALDWGRWVGVVLCFWSLRQPNPLCMVYSVIFVVLLSTLNHEYRIKRSEALARKLLSKAVYYVEKEQR